MVMCNVIGRLPSEPASKEEMAPLAYTTALLTFYTCLLQS